MCWQSYTVLFIAEFVKEIVTKCSGFVNLETEEKTKTARRSFNCQFYDGIVDRVNPRINAFNLLVPREKYSLKF